MKISSHNRKNYLTKRGVSRNTQGVVARFSGIAITRKHFLKGVANMKLITTLRTTSLNPATAALATSLNTQNSVLSVSGVSDFGFGVRSYSTAVSAMSIRCVAAMVRAISGAAHVLGGWQATAVEAAKPAATNTHKCAPLSRCGPQPG
jgi:hypothetical protein